jgi:hypothetical protein
MLRTITDVLGIDHLSVFDANQAPMTDVFDTTQVTWSYSASASTLLKPTALPLPSGLTFASATKPTHNARYWADRTRRLDFSEEDKVDALAYNKVLWAGLMGGKRYPANRRSNDQAVDRQQRLKTMADRLATAQHPAG